MVRACVCLNTCIFNKYVNTYRTVVLIEPICGVTERCDNLWPKRATGMGVRGTSAGNRLYALPRTPPAHCITTPSAVITAIPVLRPCYISPGGNFKREHFDFCEPEQTISKTNIFVYKYNIFFFFLFYSPR